ncbi:hypothetical protein KKH13_05255 [Patescibacteria group bacterium]|nr:hypothetical protein [Patescibacteria group bacterium]
MISIEQLLKPNEDIVEYLDKQSALIWMVLGDGNITIPARGKNGFFQVIHREDAKDYIEYKAEILSYFTRTSVKLVYHSKAKCNFWQLWTKCHPVFNQVRARTYINKRKMLDSFSLKRLTPLGLAILYQDDGRLNESKSTISINKPMFSKLELEALAKVIVDKWGIIFRIRRSCKLLDGTIGHELGLRYSDKDKFFSLIEPFIVPSMLYKIGRGGSAKADDEVLWTSWQHEEAGGNDQLAHASA